MKISLLIFILFNELQDPNILDISSTLFVSKDEISKSVNLLQ